MKMMELYIKLLNIMNGCNKLTIILFDVVFPSTFPHLFIKLCSLSCWCRCCLPSSHLKHHLHAPSPSPPRNILHASCASLLYIISSSNIYIFYWKTFFPHFFFSNFNTEKQLKEKLKLLLTLAQMYAIIMIA